MLVLVAVLMAIALKEYRNEIESSQAKLIAFQASTFNRAIENVRAVSIVQKTRDVEISPGIRIYLGDSGWPIASNLIVGVKKYAASDDGCRSLWFGLFKTPISSSDNNVSFVHDDYEISLINKKICRYIFSRKQEGTYFFDYDVTTGEVVITESS